LVWRRVVVSVGKPRTAYITPVTAGHYHVLPAATTKPKQPKNLASIEDIVVTVDTQSGGPEGRAVRHGRVFQTAGSVRPSGTVGSDPPDTAFASFWAYGLIIAIKGYKFGKEFLRMAGIVQMLHALQPPNDKYLLNAHTKRIP